MNAKAALAKALLDGRTLNVKNCFETIGLTNCSREISRMIEKPFGISVRRTRREGFSQYESPITWVDYKLFYTQENAEGIMEMKKYVNKQMGNAPQVDANGYSSHDFPENDARVRNENPTPNQTTSGSNETNFIQLSLTL